VSSSLTFPDDGNGDVLRAMVQDGDDLSVSRNVDFEHVFPSLEGALAFIGAVANRSDTVQLSWFDEEGCWNVQVTRHMVPTHQGVTELELSLGRIARNHGGSADGWGCVQVDASDS
jgi:hypothetical protein